MYSLHIDYSLKFPNITRANLSIEVPFTGIIPSHFIWDLLESKDDFSEDRVLEKFKDLAENNLI